jgi:4-amino-4-deoxy-L-arabinose transferase-like glycosyltransferase
MEPMFPRNKTFMTSLLPGLAVLVLFLPTLGRFHLLGMDESTFAHVAKCAGLGGHWLPPYWDSDPFVDKPPLQLWLMGLCVQWLGPAAWALRLPSALFAAVAASSTYTLARRAFGKSSAWAMVALLVSCKAFMLFGRIGNLDMGLAACCLAALASADGALEEERAGSARTTAWLWVGFWIALGLLIKHYVALFVVPPCLLALAFSRPAPGLAKRLAWGLFLPLLLALAMVFLVYGPLCGGEFWHWTVTVALKERLQNSTAARGGLGQGLDFYLALIQGSMAYVWPLLPLGLVQSWRQLEDPRKALILGFSFLYAFAALAMTSPFINYLCPLIAPMVLIACATWGERSLGSAAGLLACAIALWASFLSGSAASGGTSAWPALCVSLAAPLALAWEAREPSARWERLARILALASACILCLALLISSGRYLVWPPDPNAAWVAAVEAHPAPHPGDTLFIQSDHVTARVLSYYSDWKVLAFSQLPPRSPGPAMLAMTAQGPRFWDSRPSPDQAALRAAMAYWEKDPRVGAASGAQKP